MQNQKPPLKWAGGKRWLVPFIQPLWRKYQSVRLVEPFCGGISIALGLMPQKDRKSVV
jgi:DNA adenine methylase